MTGDMTKGSPAKVLTVFALPLILANLFQQLYNTTDAIIVGRYVGKNALAAVGVANPIMSVALFFIFGICLGTSVLMSGIFGAGKYEELKREVSTALLAGLMFTIVLSAVSILLSKQMLILIGTPPEIINDANIFLKIIFGGLIFSFLYNFYSSALRAIGDSKTPLIFLLISCFINVILCVVFIKFLRLGVAGSAVATVISQGISSLLCIIYVYAKVPLISLNYRELTIDKNLLGKTIQYSWVSALQQTFLYIGKLLVQGVVNTFGTDAVAAYNSVTRVDAFVLSPGDGFAAAVSTYAAQNLGAGKKDRLSEGYKKGNIIITIYSVTVAVIIFFGAEFIMKQFVPKGEIEVISIGIQYLKPMSLFYVLSGFCNIFQGFFRGVGKLRITLIATVLQMSIRVFLSYILAPYFNVSSVCYAVGIGWVFMITYEYLSYRKYQKESLLQ